MGIINSVKSWWRRRQHEQEIRRRYSEFMSSPSTFTRSPWIRSLIASPVWTESASAPGSPRKLSISRPAKTHGRDYVMDLLRIEQCIRFRGREWSWQGIFMAMGDDLLQAVYAEEYARILAELRVTCPDETLRSGGGYSKARVLGVATGIIAVGTKAMPRKQPERL